MNDVHQARLDVTRSSGGGVGFLSAYAATMTAVTAIAFFAPPNVAALAFLFQGGVALPLAYFLERRLGLPAMATENPLRPLVIQLAMVQVVALPAAILVYGLEPAYVPAVFAAVAGGHFVPYVWLHGTRAYLALALAVSLAPFVLMGGWGAAAFPFVPCALALLYATMAVVLRRRHGDGATVGVAGR